MIKNLTITIISIGLLIISFSVKANQISLPPEKTVALSKAEYSQIENLACLSTYKVKAEAITGYQYPDRILKYAHVECKPHDTLAYQTPCPFENKECNPKYALIYYKADCALKGEHWKCRKAPLVTSVNLNDRDIEIRARDISPKLAYDILSKVITYGSFQGTSLDHAIGSGCTFSRSSDNEIVNMECLATIRVSFFCPQPQITHCPRVLDVGDIIWR